MTVTSQVTVTCVTFCPQREQVHTPDPGDDHQKRYGTRWLCLKSISEGTGIH